MIPLICQGVKGKKFKSKGSKCKIIGKRLLSYIFSFSLRKAPSPPGERKQKSVAVVLTCCIICYFTSNFMAATLETGERF